MRKFILIFWFCEKGRLEEVGRFGKCRAELECALIVCSPNHILRPAVFSKISDFLFMPLMWSGEVVVDLN